MQKNGLTLLLADLIAFLSAFAIGGGLFWAIRHRDDPYLDLHNWTTVYLYIVPVAIFLFYQKGLYTRRWPFWDEMRAVSSVLAIIAILEGNLIFLTKSSFPRIWFVASFCAIFAVLPLFRYYCKRALLHFGCWQLSTVIFGSGPNSFEALDALQSERLMGFDVKALWQTKPDVCGVRSNIPVLKFPKNPICELSELGINCVVFALENDEVSGRSELIENVHRYTNDLYIIPALRGVPLYGMEIHHFFRHEVIMMRVRNNLSRPIPRFMKRAFDVLGSLLLLTILAPFFGFLGWRICRDGGPAFFGHDRVGFHGEVFKCFKFRSMVANSQEVLQDLLASDPAALAEWETDFKLKNDPRITRIGAFLRKTSLDELPQLWNVLKGEMSLVGPRPIVDEELKRYGEQVDYYLQVKPGMTGLWQVSGRNDVDYEHRVYLDVWYVKNWSMWYDIAILFKTFKVVLGKQGAY